MRFNIQNWKRNDTIFVLSLFLYQIVFIFQGLDFADQGVYATTYQQIFIAPESIRWGYWMSMIIGGVWLKLFPSLGLIGIRLAGVIITTLTLLTIFITFKKYLRTSNLRLGLFIAIVLFSCQSPFDLYYNNISAFFWVLASISMFRGLTKGKPFYVAISGAIIAFNSFNRLPNLLGFIIIVSIIYYGILSKQSIKKQVLEIAAFLIGFFSGIFFVLLFMILIDHTQIFFDQVSRIQTMGKSAEDPHSVLNLLSQYVIQFSQSIAYVGFVIISLLVYISVLNICPKKGRKSINYMMLLLILLGLILFVTKNYISFKKYELFIIGFAFLANLYYVLKSGIPVEIRVLSLLGIIMMIVYPFGSGGGFLIAGTVALWISLPIGIDFIKRSKYLTIDFKLDNVIHRNTFTGEGFAGNLANFAIFTSIILGLYYASSSPYFDRSSRLEMRYSVNHKQLKGIYTTKERAHVIQELLEASSRFVEPYDYVIAYDNIPMYHYLTQTIPYLGTPWPGIQPPEVLQEYFNIALQEKKVLPVVVIQKVNTLDTNWPENSKEGYNNLDWSKTSNPYFKGKDIRDSYMTNFLNENNYEVVWENIAFLIMQSNTHNRFQ